MAFKKPKRKRYFKLPGQCPFCKSKKEPDYKDPEELIKFTTDRGKIISQNQTGLCAKHQRRLTVEIKRARHLALMPFLIKAKK